MINQHDRQKHTCRLMNMYNYSHLIFDKDGKISVEKAQDHQKDVQGKLDDHLWKNKVRTLPPWSYLASTPSFQLLGSPSSESHSQVFVPFLKTISFYS